jgi:hypothetical protein
MEPRRHTRTWWRAEEFGGKVVKKPMRFSPTLFRIALLTGAVMTSCLHTGLTGATTAVELPWRAGAASINITPEKPMFMAGYAGRTKPSEGVDLDLHAKALVLEDSQGAKFVWVTLDLIGVPRTMRRRLAEEVFKKYGVPPERLVLNASHTHCGPGLRSREGSPVDELAQSEDEAVRYTATL